nr:PREDICTED: FK506-binding protein-like [Lepisosteus oculatus]
MQGRGAASSWVSVTPSGWRAVSRRTLERGSGVETPKLGSVCRVRVQSQAADDPGAQADRPTGVDAQERQEDTHTAGLDGSPSSVVQVPLSEWVELRLGEGQCDVIEGCLESMRAGGVCELLVTALDSNTGPKGRVAERGGGQGAQPGWRDGAPPPPCQRLRVELQSFSPGRESWEMSLPEKWAWIRAHKQRGGERFRAGDVWGAADCYGRALRLLATLSRGGAGASGALGSSPDDRGDEDKATEGQSVSEGEYRRVRSELHANMSLCQLKLGQPHKARVSAAQATELDPASTKAWFRLGLACSELGELDAARTGLTRVLELQPGSASALRALRDIEAREKAISCQLGRALSKMFT